MSIILIPIVDTLKFPTDYCLVRLINTSLKIISKILHSCLSRVIVVLVKGITQSVFIKGQYFMDNVVTPKELLFNLQKYKILSNILKVDFAKAFDMA